MRPEVLQKHASDLISAIALGLVTSNKWESMQCVHHSLKCITRLSRQTPEALRAMAKLWLPQLWRLLLVQPVTEYELASIKHIRQPDFQLLAVSAFEMCLAVVLLAGSIGNNVVHLILSTIFAHEHKVNQTTPGEWPRHHACVSYSFSAPHHHCSSQRLPVSSTKLFELSQAYPCNLPSEADWYARQLVVSTCCYAESGHQALLCQAAPGGSADFQPGLVSAWGQAM